MILEKKIAMLAAQAGISQSELARRIGTSPQNLHQKARRGKFSEEDRVRIAEACGAKYRCYFVLEDGTEI